MDMAAAAEVNLRWLLQPMAERLDDPKLTDFYINGAGEGMSFLDRGSGMERVTLPYTHQDLEDIAINAAALTRQDIAEDVPLVSTRFPNGHRVQIIRPPTVADGQFSFSIRKPKMHTATPDELARGGVFDDTVREHCAPGRQQELLALYRAGQWQAFLELAVADRLNIVFSGTVGSGKTHCLRAFTHAMPLDWRIVTIEDMPELIGLPHANVVNLFYSKGGQSVANVSALDLVEAALRMGMDGLLVQELRDNAAASYVNVLRSGHWGMTTTHSDSAGDVFDRIAGLVGDNSPEMHRILRRHIHVVVHCVREGNRRRIEQVLYEPVLDDQQASVAIAAE